MLQGTLQWNGKGNSFTGVGWSGKPVLFEPGEGGRGVSPMEAVLLALGGCSAVDVVGIMEKQRERMTDFKIELAAERAPEFPRVYTYVKMEYHFWGHDLSEEKVRRAVELTVDKYCSVLHMVNKTAKIDVSWHIHQPEA